jgi:hypothetical protein
MCTSAMTTSGSTPVNAWIASSPLLTARTS